jgi:hypothetical protein
LLRQSGAGWYGQIEATEENEMSESTYLPASSPDRINADTRPVVLSVGFALSDKAEAWRDFRAVAVSSQAQAVAKMFELAPAVVLIDLELTNGSPLAVADFASYRYPDARIIFVSESDMFADGSVFAHCPNVHAHVGRGMAEPDMVALVSHHARGAAAS